jgi:hypothetical protein
VRPPNRNYKRCAYHVQSPPLHLCSQIANTDLLVLAFLELNVGVWFLKIYKSSTHFINFYYLLKDHSNSILKLQASSFFFLTYIGFATVD